MPNQAPKGLVWKINESIIVHRYMHCIHSSTSQERSIKAISLHAAHLPIRHQCLQQVHCGHLVFNLPIPQGGTINFSHFKAGVCTAFLLLMTTGRWQIAVMFALRAFCTQLAGDKPGGIQQAKSEKNPK